MEMDDEGNGTEHSLRYATHKAQAELTQICEPN